MNLPLNMLSTVWPQPEMQGLKITCTQWVNKKQIDILANGEIIQTQLNNKRFQGKNVGHSFHGVRLINCFTFNFKTKQKTCKFSWCNYEIQQGSIP